MENQEFQAQLGIKEQKKQGKKGTATSCERREQYFSCSLVFLLLIKFLILVINEIQHYMSHHHEHNAAADNISNSIVTLI